MHIQYMSTLMVRMLCALALAGCSTTSAGVENYTILDNSPQAALSQIGTVGTPDFDANKSYKLLMKPTLIDGNVEVPSDVAGAVRELALALPLSYQKQLRTIALTDSNSRSASACKSKHDELDFLVRRWLIAYWRLDDSSSAIARLYANRGNHPVAMAGNVMIDFCAHLERSKAD